MVDSIQPSVEPMRLAAEAMRSQLSWLDKDFSGLAAVKGLGALITERNKTSLAQFEPIGAMFAREFGSALSVANLDLPKWPPPGMIAGLSMFGEQAKLVSESIAPDLGVNLASMFTTLSRNIDLGMASKLADVDTGRLFALLGDEDEAEGSVVDEIADEFDVDRSGVLAARDVLRAVVGLIFDSLGDPDGWARAGARALDEQVNALYDAHGDNPYIWLIGVVSTLAWVGKIALEDRNRKSVASEQVD